MKISFKKIPNPLSVATWLIDHTGLTFEQIADFCQISLIEVNSIANEPNYSVSKKNPINIFVTQDEIDKCEKNPKLRLKFIDHYLSGLNVEQPKVKEKYTISRKNRACGILYLLNNYKELSDSKIAKLTKTTVNTVKKIKDKTFEGYSLLEEKNPSILGLCFEKEIQKALKSSS